MNRIQLPRQRFLACLCMCALLQGGLWANFSAPVAMAQKTYQAAGSGLRLEEAGHTVKALEKAVRSGLNGYDQTPLGSRTPIILIHGIGASAGTDFNWERFLDFAVKEPGLLNRYKIYLYHYDSSRSVPDISINLQQTLKTFIQGNKEKPIKIVAYSEGGLLTRNALQDPYLNQYTDEVITIATPFHGSPLANPDWVRQQIKTESRFSLMRMSQKIAYGITKRLYPSFREDFHWDNFDGAMPPEQYSHRLDNQSPTDYALAHKKRFVTYGSYFGLEVDPALMSEKLDNPATVPKEKLLFGNLFRRNVLFSVVRHTIAKLPLAIVRQAGALHPGNTTTPTQTDQLVGEILPSTDQQTNVQNSGQPAPRQQDHPEDQSLLVAMTHETDNDKLPSEINTIELDPMETEQALPTLSTANTLTTSSVAPKTQPKPSPESAVSMMMFNDGISPISSTLWLGRYISSNQGASISVEKLWDTLKKLKGNSNTRLFAGMDHRNWMDGTTRTGEAEIQDLLNPEEPPRTIFGWIIYDLMS